jgi:hypothetical protein
MAVSHVIPEYFALFTQFLDGSVAAGKAPVPDDPLIRAHNLKASAYFLDAASAGVCEIVDADWGVPNPPAQRYAFVFLVGFGRQPRRGEAGANWIYGSNVACTDLRVAELAVVLSGYVRAMGYAARGHVAGATQVDIERLAVRAGVVRAVQGRLVAPYIEAGFRLGVVTTEYALAADKPLVQPGITDLWRLYGPGWWLGMGGTRPGWTRLTKQHGSTHRAYSQRQP